MNFHHCDRGNNTTGAQEYKHRHYGSLKEHLRYKALSVCACLSICAGIILAGNIAAGDTKTVHFRQAPVHTLPAS